ncbi:acyl carrier protein [Streptomyces sp. NPDC059009]|uniref:acyl carrier protein n=1 Tax=Streptomyces sp. NPDC059009 TaxID=3346694 RepID=UPI0036CAC23E
MHLRLPVAARLTAAAALALATVVAAAPAHGVQAAPAQDGPPAQEFTVTLSSSVTTTDYDHRSTDLSGTVTRADGTPLADAPVTLLKTVRYYSWNPWGDPIDPTERESLRLGTVRTDAQGRFALDDVRADRWQDKASTFLFPQHEVDFTASYDPGDPDDNEVYLADTTVTVKPVASSISYHVNRTKVRAGDTLLVTGKVTWPDGHGPVAGTRVLLRTYYESAYNAQATTDAHGNFAVRAKIRDYDNQFVVFSTPKDYYVAGADKTLPVKNVTRP